MVSSCSGNPTSSLRKGDAAPHFTLSDFSGDEHSLSDFKGSVVFIDFWASWCPPCRAATPVVEELYHNYQHRADQFQVIGINLDQSSGQAEQYINDNNISYLTLKGASSNVSRDYGVRGIPAFFLIDAEGNFVKQYVGFRPGYGQEWREEIDKLLK